MQYLETQSKYDNRYNTWRHRVNMIIEQYLETWSKYDNRQKTQRHRVNYTILGDIEKI